MVPRLAPVLLAAAVLVLTGCTVAPGGASSSRPATAASSPSDGCARVLVVSVRGTTEKLDDNLLQPAVQRLVDTAHGPTSAVELDYPALFTSDSVTQGVADLVQELNRDAAACPHQRSVLLGYSQGALVVGDALSAPDARLVPSDAGVLTAAAGSAVAAIALFGDPRYRGSTTYDVGGPLDSQYARPVGALDAYAARIRDYCDDDDIICHDGASGDGHDSYGKNGMLDQGAAFALAQLAG